MNDSTRRLIRHHLLRAAILTGFALLIVQLSRGGSLQLYIAPRMALYVKLSAIGLYVTAAYQVYTAIRLYHGHAAADCGCEHGPSKSNVKNFFVYGLFILPLALGFLLPDSTLGSAIAAKKGINLGAQLLAAPPAGLDGAQDPAPLASVSDAELDKLFPYDEYTEANAALGKKLFRQSAIVIPEQDYIETLTTLDLYRRNFVGKTVEITGFVFRQEGMTNTQMAVSRFAMNCCSADALPYGLMVESPHAARYKNDVWLKVRGTVAESSFNGKPILVLNAARIQLTAAPESPYVYPDYDFGHS